MLPLLPPRTKQFNQLSEISAETVNQPQKVLLVEYFLGVLSVSGLFLYRHGRTLAADVLVSTFDALRGYPAFPLPLLADVLSLGL
jgi:hypothetical protein